MKRPWILSPRGQRISMILATLVSLLVIPVAVAEIAEDSGRTPQPLDPAAIEYCEVRSCGKIAKLENLEVVGVASIEPGEYGILIEVRLINHGGLVGEREVWAELRSETGSRIESMRGVVTLSPKGMQLLELFFTGSLGELESGTLSLGF